MDFIKYYFVFLFIALVFICDYKTFKIKNIIILPSLLFGFTVNIYENGLTGFMFSFTGMAFPLIFIIFYALSMIGAGDIKAFCALGSIFGFEKILYIIEYSFIAGGIISLVMIIVNRNGLKRIKYLFNYIKFCFLNQSLVKYSNFDDKTDKSLFRFSSAILIGTLLFLFIGSLKIL